MRSIINPSNARIRIQIPKSRATAIPNHIPARHEAKKKRPACQRVARRFQAESNCCARFCRPLPHHSAMEPDCECKGMSFLFHLQIS